MGTNKWNITGKEENVVDCGHGENELFNGVEPDNRDLSETGGNGTRAPYHYMKSDFTTSVIKADGKKEVEEPPLPETPAKVADKMSKTNIDHYNRHCGAGYAVVLRIIFIMLYSGASVVFGLWFYSLPFIYPIMQYMAIPLSVIVFLVLYLITAAAIKLFENIIYIRMYAEHIDRMLYLQSKK
ncbi:MAG: hypothetical protein ACYCX2_08145 [Christensenellales bacterium]